jgi:hypothetical protein
MKMNRRRFLGWNLGAGAALVFLPACHRRPAPTFGSTELETMSAAAEALVPETETPGADAAWARGFVANRLRTRPELTDSYAACARALEGAAVQRAGRGFAAQSVAEREAIIRSLCPSLSMTPHEPVSAEQLKLRRPLNDIVVAFFASDHLGIDDEIYQPTPRVAPRDTTKSAPVGYSTGRSFPDSTIMRVHAQYTGIGAYNRAFAAAGLSSAPGVCKSVEEITTEPKLGG